MQGEIALEKSKGGPGAIAWFTIPFERYDGKLKVESISDVDTLTRFQFDMENSIQHDRDMQNGGSVSLRNGGSSSPVRMTSPGRTIAPPRQESVRKIASVSKPSEQLGKGLKILVVEDDRTMRTVATKHLEKFGCQVYEAANGAEGYRMLEEALMNDDLPDMVFTDCRMPVMVCLTLWLGLPPYCTKTTMVNTLFLLITIFYIMGIGWLRVRYQAAKSWKPFISEDGHHRNDSSYTTR